MTFLHVLPGSVVPTIEVEVDFVNDPTSSTITWTDITPYVVSYSRDPVRTNEFDQPQPTGARLKLRNDDARFTPDNAAGPYYGKLKKLRRCQIRAQWGGTIYNRFWGYVQDWPQTWDEYGRDQSVSLTLQDGMFPLGTYDLAGQDLAGTVSGAAIGTILTEAGITAQALDTGRSLIADSGTLNPRSFALQEVRDIAASENGVVFADGGGTVRFHDRSHRLTDYGSVMGTIGDRAGEIPYTNPQPLFGDAWPVVNITPFGGTAFLSSSVAAGTASFFQQTLTFPPAGTYLVASSAEALEAAQYLSSRYAAPVTRIAAVDLVGARDPTQWPTILGLDTSERVIFRRRFLSNGTVGGTVEVDGFIEGYADTVEVGQSWGVSVSISPANLQKYWLLGDATFGLLGDTTVLGY